MAFIAGTIVFLFLSIFQPFGLDSVESNKILYFGGYGLITTLSTLFNMFVVMKLFKFFFVLEKWTVWKSYIHNVFIILFISFFNWLYYITFEKPVDSDYSFFQFIFITLAVGIFPSFFSIFFLEQKYRKINLLLSQKVNNHLNLNSSNNSNIEDLTFNFPNSQISIKVNNFVCIKSMGNYVTLYFLEDGNLKKEIIRTTMKKIEDDFTDNKIIIRCHKSYFVNLNKVVTTSGNARSLYLHLNELDFQIPVSRSFSKDKILGTI